MRFVKFFLFLLSFGLIIFFYFSCSTIPQKKTFRSIALHNYGELFIVSIHNPTIDKKTAFYILKMQPAGFLLTGKAFTSSHELLHLIKTLYDLSTNTTPWIIVDEEGGDVNRFRNLIGELPSQKARAEQLSLLEETQLLRSYFQTISLYGINMNFAPVADILTSPQNSFLKTRCFSANSAIVLNFTKTDSSIYKELGFASVLKHFPNHGAINVDSHQIMPILNLSKNIIQNSNLSPYLINREENIMLSHILWTNIDKKFPCSLSPKVINYIRDNLDFSNLLITDDLNMQSITKNFNLTNAVVQALSSGVNLLLFTDSLEHIYQLYQKSIFFIEPFMVHPQIKKNLAIKKRMQLKKKKKKFLSAFNNEANLLKEIETKKQKYNRLFKDFFSK